MEADTALCRRAGRLRFAITSVSKDRFTLAVSPENTPAPGDSVGLTGDISFAREGIALRSVSFRVRVRTPGTKELSQEPSLASRLEGVPELGGVTLKVAKAQLSIEPETALHVSCGIEKNDWIDEGRVTLAYAKGALRVEPAVIKMPGLAIDASASLGPDSLDAAARILVTDMRWLRTLRPGTETPDTVSADIAVRVKRRTAERRIAADIDASGRAGGFSWDDLRMRSVVSLDSEKPSTIRLAGRMLDYHVGLSAEVDTRDPVVLRLSPIIVRTQPIDVSSLPAPGADAGDVRFFRETHALVVENLRVVGDEGRSNDRGRFRRTKPRRRIASAAGGRILRPFLCARWDCPGSERILSTPSGTETLLSPSISTAISRWKRDTARTSGGRFALPGPRNLATLLPDSARVSDMGPVEGTMSLVLSGDSTGTIADLLLDLTPTAWIDSSKIHTGFQP